MNTAENDEFRGFVSRSFSGKPKRVPPEITDIHDLAALIMVCEDKKPVFQSLLNGPDLVQDISIIRMFCHICLLLRSPLRVYHIPCRTRSPKMEILR